MLILVSAALDVEDNCSTDTFVPNIIVEVISVFGSNVPDVTLEVVVSVARSCVKVKLTPARLVVSSMEFDVEILVTSFCIVPLTLLVSESSLVMTSETVVSLIGVMCEVTSTLVC